MRKTQIRNDLHKLIDTINDEGVLKAVHTILSKQDEVAGYSIKGEPISAKELRKKVKAASIKVRAGNFVDHQVLTRQANTW